MSNTKDVKKLSKKEMAQVKGGARGAGGACDPTGCPCGGSCYEGVLECNPCGKLPQA